MDLTAAGVIPANSCFPAGKAYAVSRSSGQSCQAQMKDLVGPANFNLSNCGTIKIVKHTAPTRGINQNFSYTTTGGLTPNTFTLNDNGNTTGDSTRNTRTYSNVVAGNYTVTETAPDASTGFVFDSLTCQNSGGNSTTISRTANITMVGGGSTTCTYVNKQQLGAIKITKTSTKGNSPLADAAFSITKGGSAITGSPFATGGDGTVCVDGLAFGDYVVKETAAPTGYKVNDTTEHTVTVDNNAKCSDATFVGEPLSFSDTPLSEIGVTFKSLAGTDITKSSIACEKPVGTAVAPVSENGSADPAFDDTNETFTNLEPGTYTCTVVIDP